MILNLGCTLESCRELKKKKNPVSRVSEFRAQVDTSRSKKQNDGQINRISVWEHPWFGLCSAGLTFTICFLPVPLPWKNHPIPDCNPPVAVVFPGSHYKAEQIPYNCALHYPPLVSAAYLPACLLVSAPWLPACEVMVQTNARGSRKAGTQKPALGPFQSGLFLGCHKDSTR